MEHNAVHVSLSFGCFVAAAEPGLRRALAGHMPIDDVADALGEAFGYAWEHWDSVQLLDNPAGYLFPLAQSRTRRRRVGYLAPEDPLGPGHVEPGLAPAMRSLPGQQRSVVWLVQACGWSYAETAAALGISPSAVGTHLTRGMARRRAEPGVDDGR